MYYKLIRKPLKYFDLGEKMEDRDEGNYIKRTS